LAPRQRSIFLPDDLSQLIQSFDSGPDFLLDRSAESAWAGGWLPAVDLHDGKDTVTVKAELPGMKKEDINITLQDGVLTLSGERKGSREENQDGVARSERWFGRFERSISLPCQVDAKTIQAGYRDGVLSVELAKAEAAKPKQIKIEFN
jgi:HSP20 family protein